MRLTLLAVALLCSACRTGLPAGSRGFEYSARPFGAAALRRAEPSTVPIPRTPSVAFSSRQNAVKVAQRLIGKREVSLSGVRYRDCAGFVVGVFKEAGVDLRKVAADDDTGVTALYRFAEASGRTFQRGVPVPGDLVFFKDTYDRNRDGRLNDGLTHVGIVEGVDDDGTVRILHRVVSGVVRYRMNLSQPDARISKARNVVVNDYLRAAGPRSRAQLTSQLFAGFGSLGPADSFATR